MSEENEWIEWSGGECPVPANTDIDVRHADGTKTHGVLASDCADDDPRFGYNWWKHEDCAAWAGGFIVAYRVVQS